MLFNVWRGDLRKAVTADSTHRGLWFNCTAEYQGTLSIFAQITNNQITFIPKNNRLIIACEQLSWEQTHVYRSVLLDDGLFVTSRSELTRDVLCDYEL